MHLDIARIWAVSESLEPLTKTAWSVGAAYILKSAAAHHAERNLVVMKALLRHGLPVARVVPTVDGREYHQDGAACYILMHRLPGRHIEHIYAEDYVAKSRLAGQTLARLHQALRSCQAEIDIKSTLFADELQGWIGDELAKEANDLIAPQVYQPVIAQLCAVYPRLPQQLIHRDPHFGNMLFEGETLVGFLDFDISKTDCRLFDICYFALSFLQLEEPQIERKWLSCWQAFLLGYQEEEPLLAEEKSAALLMMQAQELLFVAYFLRLQNRPLAENAAAMHRFLEENGSAIEAAFAIARSP